MAFREHRDLAFYPCKPLDFKAAVINKVCSGCKKYHNYVVSTSEEFCLIRFHVPRGINRYKNSLYLLPCGVIGRREMNFDTGISEAELILFSSSWYRFWSFREKS